MTANKMPESPIGLFGWLTSSQQAVLKLHEKDCYMAGYLAGLEDAKACVGEAVTYTDLKGPEPHIPEHNAYNRGVAEGINGRRTTTLANLTALEQEAKK